MTATTEQERDDAAEPEASGAAPSEAPATEPAGAADPAAALKKERDELFDRLQRVSAEFQNFQKRTARDRAKWQQDAARDVVGDFFSVLDGLDLAISAFDREVKDPKVIRQGFELCRDDLRRKLEGRGVVSMNAQPGQPFDPERHQAVMFEEVEGLAREEIGMVARNGWLIGDAVLRPAQVSVRKPKG
jgi:molecular chaperone GrpE